VSDCQVCLKHKNFESVTGVLLAERGGWFLSHFPFLLNEKTVPGHLLIETARHITELSEMTNDEAAALGSLIRNGSSKIKSILGAEHIYVVRINDVTPHLHFHLVPRYANTPKEWWGPKIMQWPERRSISHDEIKILSKKLKF
jgi:histidine triad (HIT) family protein